MLTELLNRLSAAQRRKDPPPVFTDHDAQRVLAPLPFYRCTVPYPSPTTDQLLDIYARGGLLIADDAAHFLRQTLDELVAEVGYLPTHLRRAIGRLRELALEHTLLDAVLEVDVFLHMRGELLACYWLAYQMQEAVQSPLTSKGRLAAPAPPWTAHDQEQLQLLVRLQRWLDTHGDTDACWLRRLLGA